MANGLSCRELAKKYSVSKSVVAKKIKDEEWRGQSRTIADSVRADVDTAIREQKTDALLTMLHAADTMAGVLDSLADAAMRVASSDDRGSMDVKKIEGLVRAINLNMDTLRELHGVPTQAHRHAQKLAEERLAMERERLEMDKRKADQEAHPETVSIVIKAPEGAVVDA
jgi:hypothetical protein